MVKRALVISLVLCLPKATLADERPNKAQALLFSTAFGFYEGVALTYLALDNGLIDTDAGISLGAMLTLGTTIGSAAATNYVVDHYGVNSSQTTLFNSSLFWAVLNGATLGVHGDFSANENITAILLSGWTGQAMGILLARNVHRTSGQADAMNSAALWSGAEASLILGAATADAGAFYLTLGTGVADLALLLSAMAVKNQNISSSRVRMLDLGALCGGLAGPAGLFMAWGPEDYVRASYLTSIAIGIPVGIAFAWHLTRDFDRDTTADTSAGRDAALARGADRFMVPLLVGAF